MKVFKKVAFYFFCMTKQEKKFIGVNRISQYIDNVVTN